MTNNHKTESEKIKILRLWNNVAIIAGGFSLIVAVLLILNFLQLNRHDPVETEMITSLVERLKPDPSNDLLRNEIRAVDLLARKAYFTNQWQIRTGGYFLLVGIAIMIIAFQMIMTNEKKNPLANLEGSENLLLSQKKARNMVGIIGGIVFVSAIISAALSHQKLQKFYLAPAVAENVEIIQIDPGPERAPESQTVVSQGEVAGAIDTISTESKNAKQTEDKPANTETQAVKPDIKPVKVEQGTKDPAGQIVELENPQYFPTFRGPGGNGIAYQKNIPVSWNGETGENVLWKVPIPLPGFNSPITWGEKLFLSGADESKREVYCIDINTGNFLWAADAANIPGSPAQGPEVAGYTGHAAPSLATDGSGVFAIFSNGDIIGLDFDGNRLWARNLGVPENHYGYSSSLIVFENKVIVQWDNRKIQQVLALNVKTGETIWSTDRDVKISWASPVVVNTGSRWEIILAADPCVDAYDPNTGEQLWRVDCIYGEVGPSIAYADGMVFALNEYANLAAIKLGDKPEVLWEDTEYLSDVPSPVATDEYLIVATSYGVVVCYDTKTGTKYWEQEFDNSIYASPVICDGKVYLIDKQGIMYIFEPGKDFNLIGEPNLGEKMVCTPAFTDGRIYLRGYDNLYCIGEK
nr:PQQ-binding-like beta-propeller repeat protein [Bacteroidota bacterium]